MATIINDGLFILQLQKQDLAISEENCEELCLAYGDIGNNILIK